VGARLRHSGFCDVARQTRTQHASAPADKSGNAQGLVHQMQQEQEAAENAPTGFKSYNAGEYRILVPFPFNQRRLLQVLGRGRSAA
jgi:hypothetical protein